MTAWRMPAETAPHERLWMAFPTGGYTLGDDEASAEAARAAWASVANAAVDFEPVTVVVDPSAVQDARRHLASGVDVVGAPLDDSWMRDIGPTFVISSPTDTEPARLGAVDWTFNGWGAQDWATWGSDREIGRFVGKAAEACILPSMLVNEGGALHVDGEGTVLVTETVQLDRGRNPYADKARIEAELERTIGATKVIWVPRGLTRDYDAFGTRGHVDMVAAIPSPGVLLLHEQTDPGHPDYAVCRDLREFFAGTTDAAGRPWRIVDLEAPSALRDDDGFVDHNYVNHVVLNGAVLACGFDDNVADARAAAVLSSVYPGRTVVTLDARQIFARGGGIHCITQQQPALP